MAELAVMTQAISSREMEEVKGMIFMAKQFPRDIDYALDQIKRACLVKDVAEDGLYTFPRGKDEDGKPNVVEGPSIRLAEIIKQNWQNFASGTVELERTATSSKMKSYAWDIQTNVREEKIFDVPLTRSTKAKGTYNLTDSRDLYEATANQGARRERACILSVIPRYVTDAAVAACKETLKKNDGDLKVKVQKMTKAFEAYKVTAAMLEKYLEKKIDEVTAGDLANLRSVYNSIKDNVAQAGEFFDELKAPTTDPPPPTKLDQKLNGNGTGGAENGNLFNNG